ncbi:hypothetical protein ACHAWT_009642 [Skeletonema menzelii]
MNFLLATIVLFCSSSTLRSPCQIPIHRHGRSSSSLFVGGNGNTGKAGKGQGQGNATAGKAGKGQSTVNVGKAGKGQAKGNTTVGKAGKGQGNATAGKAVKGQGNAGGWPSTSGNPSGGRRSNADKPDNIDSNKIYNCVRSYYNDLRMSYGDIPECYYEDVRMLLATCLASTWFSDDQLRNIEQWNKDHFGYRGYRNYAFLW